MSGRTDEILGENGKNNEEDQDDYMSMVILEPTANRKIETYTQQRLRKQREAYERGRSKTKQELAAQEEQRREQALANSLFTDVMTTKSALKKNKGFAIMSKMGFKVGAPLGRSDNPEACLEPIKIQTKEDRGGIGMDKARKHRLCEESEKEQKKLKVDEGEYRERVRRERELARLEILIVKAMKVAELMHEKQYEAQIDWNNQSQENSCLNNSPTHRLLNTKAGKNHSVKSLKKINVLWRGLVQRREERESERRARSNLQQRNLSNRYLPTYEHAEKEIDDKWLYMADDDLDEIESEEDTELEDFNALEPLERLQKLTTHLRREHNYCFWCKYTYPTQEMDGCPGTTEEEHD